MSPAAEPTETRKLCAKCNENEATAKHAWCNPCKAKYQAEYNATVKEMQKGRGFAEGVEAMRETLVEQFERVGSAGFTGYELAEIVGKMPPPVRD